MKEGVFLGCFLCLGGKARRIFITAFKYSLASTPYRIPGYSAHPPVTQETTHGTKKH